MKRVILIFFVVTIAIVAVVNVNFSVKKETVKYLTLSTLEAQACCMMESSNGYEQWCHCDYTGYCPCLSGWAQGRAFFH